MNNEFENMNNEEKIGEATAAEDVRVGDEMPPRDASAENALKEELAANGESGGEDAPLNEPQPEEATGEETAEKVTDEKAEDAPYENGTTHTAEFTVNHHSTGKKKGSAKKVLALCLAGGLVFGAAFGFSSNISSRFALSKISVGKTEVSLSKSDADVTDVTSVSAIVDECMPSIVAITNRSVSNVMTFFGTYTQESTGSGSGIIIGKNDSELLIVTNYHVVSNSKELSVLFSSVEEKMENTLDIEENSDLIPHATVKGYDSDKDLAVIAVALKDIPTEIFDTIKIATMGDSTKLKAGDGVIAIGNALGYGQSTTRGIISAVNRKITMQGEDSSSQVTNSFIQTDAAINPGNSGGALLNMAGEVIGINSVKIASNGVEGMGYAIPITDVGDIIDELMVQKTRNVVDENKQGFLGITGRDVTQNTAQSFGIPMGVYVDSVTEGLAADNAGIKRGYVITKLDGYTVTDIAQLQDRLTYYSENEKVELTVQVPGENGYTEKKVTVTLSNRAKNVQKTEQKIDD